MQNKIIVLKRGKEINLKTNENFIIIDDWNDINASSTQVRNGNITLLDKPVYEYIKKKKLRYNYFRKGEARMKYNSEEEF